MKTYVIGGRNRSETVCITLLEKTHVKTHHPHGMLGNNSIIDVEIYDWNKKPLSRSMLTCLLKAQRTILVTRLVAMNKRLCSSIITDPALALESKVLREDRVEMDRTLKALQGGGVLQIYYRDQA
jgi:hypothetical protein